MSQRTFVRKLSLLCDALFLFFVEYISQFGNIRFHFQLSIPQTTAPRCPMILFKRCSMEKFVAKRRKEEKKTNEREAVKKKTIPNERKEQENDRRSHVIKVLAIPK